MRLISLLWLAMFVLTACKKQAGCMDSLAVNYDPSAEQDDGSCQPFQGPRNESFEYNGQWTFERASNLSCMGGIVSSTGVGFMPTKGVNFLFLEVGSGFSYAYQDNVDLSKASKLIFDYQLFGSDSDGSVHVDIIFTGNGNQKIWEKQYLSLTQVTNEVIYLPSLPSSGRLIIRLENDTGNYTAGRFEIDNIRVE